MAATPPAAHLYVWLEDVGDLIWLDPSENVPDIHQLGGDEVGQYPCGWTTALGIPSPSPHTSSLALPAIFPALEGMIPCHPNSPNGCPSGCQILIGQNSRGKKVIWIASQLVPHPTKAAMKGMRKKPALLKELWYPVSFPGNFPQETAFV